MILYLVLCTFIGPTQPKKATKCDFFAPLVDYEFHPVLIDEHEEPVTFCDNVPETKSLLVATSNSNTKEIGQEGLKNAKTQHELKVYSTLAHLKDPSKILKIYKFGTDF